MKVGIVTITELDNFGNRLQNYALQETLKSLGVEVETIPNYITYRYRRETKRILKEIYEGLRYRNRIKLSDILKQIRFSKFDKKYFDFSKYFSEINYISEELDCNFDYFVAGSDQIWNPYFSFNYDFNFLKFCSPSKRIVYSASFGVDEIPDDRKNLFMDYINNIKNVSVREYAGKEIIKKLCHREVPVFVDPSMLLSKTQWLKLAKKPFWMSKNENYILKYYLGKKDENKIMSELGVKYKNYRVIDIHNKLDIEKYSITPAEFIWLIDNAKIVMTDSFHGTVFSIILKTPFINQKRIDSSVSMNSRIESLYKITNYKISDLVNDYHISNSEEIDRTIELCRNKSINYLKSALKI